VIGRYLDSLSGELRVPARVRARIVAEVRDHLEEAMAGGRSEREAIAAFGEPRELAARFHEQLASTSARRAGARTATLMAAFFVALAAAALGPANDFPFGVVVFVGAQLALVAAAIGCARWLRYRHAVPAERLADMYRPNAVALACVVAVSFAELLDGVIGGGSTALVVGGAAMLAASLVAGASVARAAARARVVGAASAPAPADDALDDILAAARLIPLGARLVQTASSKLPAWRWLDLRRHPWRFCLALAIACGVALAAQHGIVEGGPARPAEMWRPLLAGLVLASIEGVAVIACFAAFGRFLGIRR
jgi:hypothetical protein